MPIPAERRRSYLARQVGTLVLSHVQTDTPMAAVRAAAWSNSLARMGVHLPLFVVHDIGVMLSMSRGAGGYTLRPREAQLARVQVPAGSKPQLDQYRRLLDNKGQEKNEGTGTHPSYLLDSQVLGGLDEFVDLVQARLDAGGCPAPLPDF